jgi:hypothetical protein
MFTNLAKELKPEEAEKSKSYGRNSKSRAL